MNIAGLWDQLVGAVCRPPRDVYEESDLVGGRRAAFSFGERRDLIRKYYRQDIELVNTRGQKLQCSHYRPCVVTSPDGRLPCVVHCHTNSGSRRDAEEFMFTLLPKGITVFTLDFSGSGRSEGDWVTLGAHEVDDLATAIQYLREEGSTSTLALWGRSMGAVTALLYSHRDPTIAGVVADSPFSRLLDLMLELATDSGHGLSVPRPLVRVALSMMRRSVRRRAGFSIDQVAPLDVAPECFVPVLFGHAKGDTFVAQHHSERLFMAHGAETKNFISFEGDHNGQRPEFWYDSAMIFLLQVLRVEELVGPDVDLEAGGPFDMPHMSGRGIYVAGSSLTEAGAEDAERRDAVVRRARNSSIASPWDFSTTRISTAAVEENEEEMEGVRGGGDAGGSPTRRALSEDDLEYGNGEEELLQRVLELSLTEASTSCERTAEGAASSPTGATTAPASLPQGYDENEALEAAIAASLQAQEAGNIATAAGTAASERLEEESAVDLVDAEGEDPEDAYAARRARRPQSAVQRHSKAEATAAEAAAAAAQHALRDVMEGLELRRTPSSDASQQPHAPEKEGEARKTAGEVGATARVAVAAGGEEERLEELRSMAARLSGHADGSIRGSGGANK